MTRATAASRTTYRRWKWTWIESSRTRKDEGSRDGEQRHSQRHGSWMHRMAGRIRCDSGGAATGCTEILPVAFLTTEDTGEHRGEPLPVCFERIPIQKESRSEEVLPTPAMLGENLELLEEIACRA